ncbi:signal peptidase I [uncultured Friedmanniella sp.]|uniref:signal peptidase I n=1 Tax=uncultured Friedmanniella sp. TaxID=335381 RepID=UPI0035C9EA0D
MSSSNDPGSSGAATDSSGSETAPAAPKGAAHHAVSFAKELLFVVLGAVVISSLLRAFVGQMFIIPSESMENTLLVKDRVVVQKITDIKRGEIVVFADPGGWLPEAPVTAAKPLDNVLEFIGVPTTSTPGHLIKRVIGMPGDTVVCCDADGRLTVNGDALDETSYLYTNPDGTQVAPSVVRFRVVVPRGRIFVMGDHRDDSLDSRCHLSDFSASEPQGYVAFVPEDLVVGPAFAIAAPFDRNRRLTVPATFTSVPPPAAPAPDTPTISPAGVRC